MRHIDKIIIHCSATEAGEDISASDIREWHLQRGWKDIGYHYVIRMDGRIENGRPEELSGSHCKGHNRYSIGVCYIGGLLGGKPADTRTPAQKQAMSRLVQRLLSKYPEATVHGHCEFAAKACPCFDVRQWINEASNG